jgi:hypothetical protein
MKRALIVLMVAALSACYFQENDPETTMYVIADEGRAESLTAEISDIARGFGYSVTLNQLTDDRSRTLYILEGRRGSIRLWVQNMPMNSLEDDRCAPMGDATIDPRQYLVSVQERFPGLGQASVKQAFSALRSSLLRKYDVLDKPLACSLIHPAK